MTSFPSAQAVTADGPDDDADLGDVGDTPPAAQASARPPPVPAPALPEVDVALVRRAQAGDRPAFEQLVRATARLVYARVYLDVGDRDLAEDLVQETYLTAWRSIAQLRDVPDASAFRRWLLAIARTTRIDAGRRAGRKKRSGAAKGGGGAADDDPLAAARDPSPTPDELAERRERHDRVLGLLKSLPDEYRLPISLRYLGGADHAAICSQLGVTSGSLRGLLNRGMAKLRGLMGAAEE